jgi:hypothetical protein
MKFKIEIVLGNAAMQTGFDVAAALESVRGQIMSGWGDHPMGNNPDGREPRAIRDVNGNAVGFWKVTK